MGPSERAAWLRLLLTHGARRVTARQLLKGFGSPEDIWQADPAHWQACVGDAKARALGQLPTDWPADVERLEAWLSEAPDRQP